MSQQLIRKRRPRLRARLVHPTAEPLLCRVCGDIALGHNYDCISCESCKTFFRRHAFKNLACSYGGHCSITVVTRRLCAACRLGKCLLAGMKRELIINVDGEPDETRARGNEDQQAILPSSAAVQWSSSVWSTADPTLPQLSTIAATATGTGVGWSATNAASSRSSASVNAAGKMAAAGYGVSNGAAVVDGVGALWPTRDPRAMQEAGRAVVTHDLLVSRSLDPRFELCITSVSRCSSVVNQVTAHSARLTPDEYDQLCRNLRCALLLASKPANPQEAESLKIPGSLYEGAAYAEHCVSRLIVSFKRLPEFAALDITDQMHILKTCASALLRMTLLMRLDLSTMCLRYRLESSVPDTDIRSVPLRDVDFPMHAVVEANLNIGLLEMAAVYLNGANYAAEVKAYMPDEMVSYLLVLLNVFSPHRFLVHSRLLATVTPLHARLLQFLKQYLEHEFGWFDCVLPPVATSYEDPMLGPMHRRLPRLAFDLSNNSICGQKIDPLVALPRTAREHLYTRTQWHQCIRSRVPFPTEQISTASYTNSNMCSYDAEAVQYLNQRSCQHADHNWLFSFCVAALTDPRVGEPSSGDIEMRATFTRQFSPLILELLDPDSSATPNSNLAQL